MSKIKMKRKSEKSAILFYQAKRQSNNPLTLERYITEWKSHWNTDFNQFKKEDGSLDDDKINEFFGAMFKAYDEKHGALSKNVMRGIRKKFAFCEVMHIRLHHFAEKRNLVISKAHKKVMGYTLGGFRISRKKSGAIVLGGDYSLSLHDVCEYFEVPEDEEQRFIREIKEKNITDSLSRRSNNANKKQPHNKIKRR